LFVRLVAQNIRPPIVRWCQKGGNYLHRPTTGGPVPRATRFSICHGQKASFPVDELPRCDDLREIVAVAAIDHDAQNSGI